jgi:RNA polymerase sigma-70 factor (ECF subfamily)
MPEPIVAIDDAPTPEDEALIADGVGLALYVVLETLNPAERLAFVLHDMFAMPYDEIAAIVGRSPEAARQLASRARRRVQGAKAEPDAGLVEQQQVVQAFLTAAREGDFDALLELLDPEVTLRVDAGPDSPLAHPPIVGAAAVHAEARRWNAMAPHSRPAIVNGVAGAVIGRPGQLFGVVAVTVAQGRITALDFVVDPAKLARITI